MLTRWIPLALAAVVTSGCASQRAGQTLEAMGAQVADAARQRRAAVRTAHTPSARTPAYQLASHNTAGPTFFFNLHDDEPTGSPAGDVSPEDSSENDLQSFVDDETVATTRGVDRPGPLPGFWDTVKRDVVAMPGDLWRDTKKVYTSVPNLIILGAAYGGSLAIQQTGPDRTIEDGLRHKDIFSDGANETFSALGNPGTHFALAGAWYLIGQQTRDEKTYNVGKKLFSALIINGLTTMAGQAATWNDAPNGEWGSMPSGHASSTFCFASVMHREYGPLVGVPLYGLGALVAIERLDDDEHYFSDVVMGAVLGLVIGHTVASDEDLELFGGQILPYADPMTGSTGIAWVKHFR